MTEEQVTDNDKLFAALSYIFWPVAIIVLLSETNKNRPFQRHHAIQALGLGIAVLIIFIPLICIDLILGQIAGILSCLFFPVFFVPLAVMLWFAYRAYQGEKFDIPYLTEFMKNQGWL